VVAAVVAVAVAGMLLLASGASACSNEQLRSEDNSLTLPDCRAYELVSPPAKNGGAIQGFGRNSGGGVLQASGNGDSATFSSAASFGADAEGAPQASQYIARRLEGSGWSTENITTPTVSGSYGDEPDGVPYQLFSPDLAAGLLFNGTHCRGQGTGCPVANPPLPGSGAPPGYQDYYLRDDRDGDFQALLTAANADLALTPEQFDLAFAGASPDLRHVVLSSCAALTDEAREVPEIGGGCESAQANLYEWSDGTLQLINVLPGEALGTPGAHLAAQAGAISTDGSRAYFTDGENSRLYLREGAQTRWVDEEQGGGGVFQTASADGGVAFFTKAAHLYRYDAATRVTTDLTPGGEVLGVLGASEDGSHIYYATANGLFLWNVGTTTKAAPAADPSDYPPPTGTARIASGGTRLAFLSSARLTGYDNAAQPEVYLYDASGNGGAGSLTCVSCKTNGKTPLGPSTILGAIANGEGPAATDAYKPRDLSADGSRLFFDSRDSLLAKDSNTHQDVYEWEAQGSGRCSKTGGCVSLISSGQGVVDAEFIDASTDGADAFFLTDSSLVAQDPGSVDLYDAREGGGYPAPPASIECDGDTCQSLPSPPEDPAIGSAAPGAGGNPPVHFPKAEGKKAHHKKRHHRKHPKRNAHGREGRR
jgi:hypothetical protein